MSRRYLQLSAYLLACCILLLVALTACKQQLPQEFMNELEAEILSSDPAVENYEISTVRRAASKKLPSSVDARWCVEVTFNPNDKNTVEYYLIDQMGESFECQQLTEDQLTFKESGCYW